MSLFKIRQFWSFDLDALDIMQKEHETTNFSPRTQSHSNAPEVQPSELTDCKFAVDIGVFHCIGSHQVFVCGSLNGLICIVQVPISQQPTGGTSQSTSNSREPQDRQLLLAKRLEYPIIDLKCGFFASALKQSIAVLSFNELVVFQVQSNPIDLLADPTESADGSPALNELLFSHRLEEHHRIRLGLSEIPTKLTVLEGRPDGSKVEDTSHTGPQDGSKDDHKRMQLPQMDMIAIQYANQFFYTIVDHKKVLGHFDFEQADQYASQLSAELDESTVEQPTSGRKSTRLDNLARFAGTMPATFLRCNSGSILFVISFSDNQIYCLPLLKLLSVAKQTVMKRVAKNLVDDQESNAISDPISALSYNNPVKKISPLEPFIVAAKLQELLCWKVELPYAPLQLLNSPCSFKQSSSADTKGIAFSATEQLFIISRYNLDLYNSFGIHLWSQRFEAPLRCASLYLSHQSSGARNCSVADRDTHFMVCTDSLASNQSTITILTGGQHVWSAFLTSKPDALWRLRLQGVNGVIALLQGGIEGTQLRVGYLGTHSSDEFGEASAEEGCFPLSKINLLNEPFIYSCSTDQQSETTELEVFKVDVQLEAFNTLPRVEVNFKIDIQLKPPITSAMHNIIGILDYDDLLQCDLDGLPTEVAPNPAQIHFGSCWPDRRDPLSLVGVFKMKSCSTCPKRERIQPYLEDNLLPKTLQVKFYLKAFSTRCGCVLQQMSFMLPLSLVASLEHIDYSYGSGQSLSDILLNLSGYDRQLAEDSRTGQTAHNPYYMCDILVREMGDVIELLDELIESDLVCRGCNSESSSYARLVQNQDRKLATLENLNLLAQSLDCRLKFKSQSRPLSMLRQQSSTDENAPLVFASIALKVSLGSALLSDISEGSNSSLIWIHLCELTHDAIDIPSDFLKLHSREWKVLNQQTTNLSLMKRAKQFVLMAVEGKQLPSTMFTVDHFLRRVKDRSRRYTGVCCTFDQLSEKHCDLIEIDMANLFGMNNLIAVGTSFYDQMVALQRKHDAEILFKFRQHKARLMEAYDKLYLSCMASLTLTKRLIDLPDNMQSDFNSLSLLTKTHYLSQVGIVSELEELKRLDYHYCKVPYIEELWMETREAADSCELRAAPHFERIVD